MSDILEQAHALGRAVLDTDVYKAMQEAKAAWLADAEAQRLEKEQAAFVARVRERMLSGEATPEEMQTMLTYGERLAERESVRRYNEATDAFGDLTNGVYQILALYLGQNKSGCEGCSGCSGR